MTVYYNENDAFAAAWLRNLIDAGHLPPGDVDDRSIVDVRPGDLTGYTQCHFFAGIGGWAYALQLAGWPGDRPVWTGSCPCQPFSSAGRQGGALDERHLWPRWLRLIRECRPDAILGEQVEGAVGFGWVDRVFADLEAEGYACGTAVLGAHSVNAPHIRQRLFWVAHAADAGWRAGLGNECGREGRAAFAHNGSATGRLADADAAGSGAERRAGLSGNGHAPHRNDADRRGEAGGVAVSEGKQFDRSWDAWRGWQQPPNSSGLGNAGEPGLPPSEREEERSGTLKGEQLPNQVAHLAGWATPRANKWGEPDSHGKTAFGSPASMEKRGALNPRFSLWLMGYPTVWASCGEAVTPSSRKRLLSS